MVWVLAAKDLRLLLRDPRSVVILLATPLVLILVLGLILGEGFGQKPDDRLRVSFVDLDEGFLGPIEQRRAVAWLSLCPGTATHPAMPLAFDVGLSHFKKWSEWVQDDLSQTAGIRVERIGTLAEAEYLIRERRRAAILVFGPRFSETVQRCSFLEDGINPFFRDGVRLRRADQPFDPDLLDAYVLRDDTQQAASAIIEQVVQVTLLRVILPWMIGRAFERLSEPAFIELLGKEVYLPVPVLGRVPLNRLLTTDEQKLAVGVGVQKALSRLFPKYELTGKTWAALTRSEPRQGGGENVVEFRDEGGIGPLRRGAVLYQTLVPAFTVAFAFFLVLTVGWLFTAERRQGTLLRLYAAPIRARDVLLGKFTLSLLVSLTQALCLLGAGKLVFGMSWGVTPLGLVPVAAATSLAAVGLALCVATAARSETQVAVYGTLLVLVLALVGGCLVPPALMPEMMQNASWLTPHAWSLAAYRELLLSTNPNLGIVARACGTLVGFAAMFLGFAWWLLKRSATG
ncbi:MAG: ABC transporter permease [Gemmataceae bacterium]|nr:ABC transporter permease [Gemmataceae bacterium]MDW8266565.1 ABC transporter permease [Gemmataceae bacterium]